MTQPCEFIEADTSLKQRPYKKQSRQRLLVIQAMADWRAPCWMQQAAHHIIAHDVDTDTLA
ncbi:hypothetical protein GCM10011533_36780 [Streptosporangium jomthongense]|nr:hypothetical protein GCM10011533_36780 [Streptosporangium jomthongense]